MHIKYTNCQTTIYMFFKKAYAAVHNMCELLLIEQHALTHSVGEAISAEGRVFIPKDLQGRLV